MRETALSLVNFEAFEAVPAALLGARGNATARAMAAADWVLRRKHDGRYLALARPGAIMTLQPQAWQRVLGRQGDTGVLRRLYRGRGSVAMTRLSPRGVPAMLRELGIAGNYGRERGLPVVPEPAWLVAAGRDRYQRPLWLTAATALAWVRMVRAAAADSVALEAISGYRSHAYQAGIFRRKRARGIALEQILRVNAAPGYSEHHSGRALDIGTPGEPAAEESFEATAAFAWLTAHAAGFGFRMSYPRDNPHGIAYEPWHWCFRA